MKKITSLCAGLFLMALSSAVLAQNEHTRVALEHANAAVQAGKAGNAKELVTHADAALEHALAGAIVAHGTEKVHLEAAANELEEAINHGNLGHADVASEHAGAAVTHLSEAK
ncbi:MAG: small metal-binding protein SmbP [Gammaproteobacteria bacterium]